MRDEQRFIGPGFMQRIVENRLVDGLVSIVAIASILLSALETENTKTWGTLWGCAIQIGLNIILTIDPLFRLMTSGKPLLRWMRRCLGWNFKKNGYWLWELFASLVLIPIIVYTVTGSRAWLVTIPYLLLPRLIRFVRLFYLIPEYRLIFGTIARLTPLFVENLGVLFTLFYFYAVTGK
jgi:hypothetical protein